jgi:2,4-dienoyl-CoA reductase-like NADH-dependent reductase (Old Yellow Enzyme family)
MTNDMIAPNRLFQPLEIGGLVLKNRLAVAPMTRVSADADGNPTIFMGASPRAALA